MSKHTHTPGPWAARYHESTDSYTIHVAGRSWESYAVAEVSDCVQDEANARLIAAAPDLLAALERIEPILSRMYGAQAADLPPVQIVRAAIAKATAE